MSLYEGCIPKTTIAAYLFFLAITTIILNLSILHYAKTIEIEKRNKIQNLAHALVTVGETTNTDQLKSNLAKYLGSNVLLTTPNNIDLKFHWQSKFAATGDSIVWTLAVGIPLMVFLCLLLVPTVLYKTIITNQLLTIRALQRQRNTYQSMQMFAHDIRKPFSSLKALLGILSKPSKDRSSESIAKKLLPEVDGLLLHVDGMIEDLLIENRSKSAIDLNKTCSLDKALSAAVAESANRHPHSEHVITWSLLHSLKPNAPEKALTRCFSNLICNAIEAMGPLERIWIKSRDCKINGNQAIEVTIGNSGMPIPKNVLSKLFTPFYSSGKAGGTGLGLAYVKKTMEELNGNIAARSDETKGTEFILTIPTNAILDKVTRHLPSHINPKRNQDALQIRLVSSIKILIVEDQEVYFESFRSTALDQIENKTNLAICHAKTFAQATKLIEREAFDLVICDLDLCSNKHNGLDVIRFLQNQKSEAKIYIYSNKCLTMREQRFVEVNTNGHIQKPADSQDLYNIFADFAEFKEKLPVVAIIDDDCFVRELWGMQSDVIDARLFSSPEEFFLKMNADPTFLELFDTFIIDYYFADNSAFTGDQIARRIRENVQTPIIMASDIQSIPDDKVSVFDGKIGKDCQSWDEVRKLVQNCA